MVQLVRTCWCGGELGKEIGRYYRCCNACGAAVLAVLPAPGHFEVSDDERDFYGRRYWTDYSKARALPDIGERVRSDLSERCLFWLERLLEVARPPGRALEIGCGHGAFVRLMQDLGFDAVGTELSGWVVEFAKRTFDVPVLRGRLETLDLEPGFTCIAAFDVLEHLSDPLETARRCGDLLAPDGVLLLQTPCYRGEGPDWSMFQKDEHIHLFTEASIRLLLARAGFREVLVRPSLFPYDMYVTATRGQLHVRTGDELEAVGDWRLPVAFRSLLDLSRKIRGTHEDRALAEADRAARLAVIEAQGRRLGEVEGERNRLRAGVNALRGQLAAAEADRATRLEAIEAQGRRLGEVEGERNRLRAEVRAVGKQLEVVEADRAARLEVIEAQGRRLGEAEAEGNSLRAELTAVHGQLEVAEADRAARLEVIEAQGRKLGEVEVERNNLRAEVQVQIEQIQVLMGQLRRLQRTFRAIQSSRMYRVLRGLGRWKFIEWIADESQADSPTSPLQPK